MTRCDGCFQEVPVVPVKIMGFESEYCETCLDHYADEDEKEKEEGTKEMDEVLREIYLSEGTGE